MASSNTSGLAPMAVVRPSCEGERYIAPIYRFEYTRTDARVYGGWTERGVSVAEGPETAARAPLYSGAVRRHTDYALARRALLRALRRGTVARHDVCDAHPELLRAARHVGEPAAHECPVCSAGHVRY